MTNFEWNENDFWEAPLKELCYKTRNLIIQGQDRVG